MLVKKINPDWNPVEKQGMQVGDTIEISDPKQLILNGDAIGINSIGEEVGGYELYGVMSPTEDEEFANFQKMKKAEATAARLKKENEELQKEAETKKAEVKVEAKVEVAPVVEKKVEAKPVEAPKKK